jgi:hypothetical protein
MKELTCQQKSNIAEHQMKQEKERRLRLNAAAEDMYKALKEIKEAIWAADFEDIFPDELDNISIALAQVVGE